MNKTNISLYIAAPLTVLIFFSAVSLVAWLNGENIITIINYIYIGLFAALGMFLFAKLPKRKKTRGRRLSMLAIGGLLFLTMGVMGRIDGQIEGFFFYILAGITAGTVNHYLVAKIIGPLFINRSWCGWGCWTAMILDLFPYKRTSGRLPGNIGMIRYFHFAFSLALVLMLWYGLDYSISSEKWDIAGMYWFLGGNLLYYSVGIMLVLWFKDNRAFCKYVCPVSVILKLTSRFSLLKISGSGKTDFCNTCMACMKTCPMNINIAEYILAGKRVLSSECIMCMTCINSCPTGALKVSIGFDFESRDIIQLKNS